MQPFEQEDQRIEFEESEKEDMNSKNRLLVEPWLPHQYQWGDVAMLRTVAGILAAFITYTTGSIFLPFGISAASLLFLNLGVVNFPVIPSRLSILTRPVNSFSTAPIAVR